ncbi:uncharacterized protein LOC143257801 [Tachypleus tridentatus]|uniref:uncharacterized protein LOC143257801 n=1 Tax=Tachypleus tridentatus TaxID=6853 RepID=UPI003FD39F71
MWLFCEFDIRSYGRYGTSTFFIIVCLTECFNFTCGSLTFNDLLPDGVKAYDKMRPPKKDGKPTKVFFHVTVMGLDSINEGNVESVTNYSLQNFAYTAGQADWSVATIWGLWWEQISYGRQSSKAPFKCVNAHKYSDFVMQFVTE